MLVTNEKLYYQTGTVLENVFGQCYPMHDSGLLIQLGCRGSCEHPSIGHEQFQSFSLLGDRRSLSTSRKFAYATLEEKSPQHNPSK